MILAWLSPFNSFLTWSQQLTNWNKLWALKLRYFYMYLLAANYHAILQQ